MYYTRSNRRAHKTPRRAERVLTPRTCRVKQKQGVDERLSMMSEGSFKASATGRSSNRTRTAEPELSKLLPAVEAGVGLYTIVTL